MLLKKKIITMLLKEYWGENCQICGSITPPNVKFINNALQEIEIACPNCGLTVTYNDHTKSKFIKNKNSIEPLELKMNICNLFI